MHFTPSFLLLAAFVGAVQAMVERPDKHEVSFMQHRRHHAKAAAVARAAQPQRRSRRSCKLNSSSILAIATATPTATEDGTSPASATPTSGSGIATSSAEESDSLSSVLSSATTSASGTSPTISSTMVSASSAATASGSAISSASGTSSSSNSTSTQSSSKPTSTHSLRDSLLPIKPLSYWTTCEDLPNSLPLNDNTLTPTHDIRELKHEYLEYEGKNAMSAFYPNGSWNLSNRPRGGFSFYATGPKEDEGGIDLTQAKEVTFGYSVFFPKDFDFVKGGKLPGLWGGDDFDGSISCSGGSRNDKCFSSRMMWRTDGMGELYTYLPPSFEANDRVCDVPPYSECNPTYGASIGRGSFNFTVGGWTAVAMRVKLNDVGEENGELELWANGESMFVVDGLVIRNSTEGRVWGDQFQTFFGGSTVDWSTPKDQNTYFADFTMAITETF